MIEHCTIERIYLPSVDQQNCLNAIADKRGSMTRAVIYPDQRERVVESDLQPESE